MHAIMWLEPHTVLYRSLGALVREHDHWNFEKGKGVNRVGNNIVQSRREHAIDMTTQGCVSSSCIEYRS